jgi:hypothetical protein
MTRTRTTAVAVAAVLIGLTGFHMIDARDTRRAQTEHASPPPERSAPRPSLTVNLPGAALTDLQSDVHALRAELDQLHREASPPPAEPSTPALPPPPSAAEEMRDSNAAMQELADQLEEQLAREARDSTFTHEASARVDAFLARPELAGTSARKIECGTSMCRVEMHHDADQSREAFLAAMSDVLPPDSQGFAHLEHERDLDVELYFSRAGYDLKLAQDPPG